MASKKGKDVLACIGWWWRDWRSSSARAAMSPLARGIYRELLDAHWGEEDCALPDDDKMLAALAGVTAEEWASVRDEILPWLPLNKNGKRQNARALVAWREARAHRKSKRAAGIRGAALRWHSHSTPNVVPMAKDSPPPPPPSPPLTSTSVSTSHTDPEARATKGGIALAPGVDPSPSEPSGLGRSLPVPDPSEPEPQDAQEAQAAAAHRLELRIICGFKQALSAVQSLAAAGATLAWIEARIAATQGTPEPWAWAKEAKAAWERESGTLRTRKPFLPVRLLK